MKKLKVFILSAFAICALATSVGASGEWRYGNSGSTGYSNYYQYGAHRSGVYDNNDGSWQVASRGSTGWTYANTSLRSVNGRYNYRVDIANY